MNEEELKEHFAQLLSNPQRMQYVMQGFEVMARLGELANKNEAVVDIKKLPVQNLLLEEQTMRYQGVTIFRNPKAKTWYARKRIDGKQIYISGKSQNKVLNKLKKLLKIEEKKHLDYYTLESWYEKWLQLFKIHAVKQVTIADYHKTMKNVPEEIMEKRLDTITVMDIVLLLDKIDKERTKQKTYELLKMIMDKAVDMDILKVNVINKLDKPKHVREKGIALSEKEQEVFLSASSSNMYGDLFKVTLLEGLRIGEVLALTGEDLNFDNKTIKVDKAMSRDKLDTTKNDQSNRLVPMFDVTLPILQKYKGYGSRRLFPITYSVAQKNMKDILSIAELPSEVSIHDLRHSFITKCKNKGIPEHVIQSWVGHEIGSKVTSTRYTHMTEEANVQFIAKFNE